MTPDGFVDRIRVELQRLADPERAPQMQAYMKSAMPYYGVPVPIVRSTVRRLLRESPEAITSWPSWCTVIRRLFDEASYREERYAALAVAGAPRFAPYQTKETLALYEQLVVDGAWWDFVDEVSHRVGEVLCADRATTTVRMREWAVHPDLWLRRSSIICQLGHRETTDLDLLTFAIDANLEDTRFFLRKAIGWALREYARTDPSWVLSFVEARATRISPLSRREALKHL